MRPEGLRGDIKIAELSEDEHAEAQLKLLFGMRQELIRANRQLYNHANPFEEYYGILDPQPAGDFEIQPTFSMPSRIESAFASLPVGITSAILTLGTERKIPLYVGAATTTQTIVSLRDVGIEVTDNDRRILTLAGTMTSGFFIGLYGHAYERFGDR